MSRRSRSLVAGAGGFLLAGTVAFAAGRALGGGDEPAPTTATASVVESVATPTPLGDGDALEVIRARAEEEAASRAVASELGLAAGGAGIGVGAPDGVPAAPGAPDVPGAPAEPEPPEPDGSAGGAADPATAIDACADGSDGCPSGVGGFVLAALRAPPPLRGMTYWQPGEDAPYDWSPTCPAIDVPPGAAYFGASTSRPATITMRYRAGRWTGDGYEVEGTFTYTTPDAAESGWNAWLADDAASEADPRGWIKQCFLIEDLPARDDYMVFVDYADKYDPTMSVSNSPYRIDFDVYLESGFVPGEQRRPTFLLGNGIDELLVGVSARPDHDFRAVAIADALPGSCDTGGDETSVAARDGAITSVEVSDNPIPADRLADPAYPYLPDHTRSLVHRLWLQEGSDYVVCLYWVEAGTSFDGRVIDIAEEVAVSTPEAYRPQILLHGFTELFGTLDQANAGIAHCGFEEVDVPRVTAESDSLLFDEPIELCLASSRLTELDRGIKVETAVHETFADGSWYSGGGWIRTDLECHADPCLLKMPELYRIPLPNVPAERRMCGTGFGGGCDGDTPKRPAGYAEVEVRYIDVAGNRRTEWSIGEADEFADTPPPAVGLAPRLDVEIDWELVGRPTDGARGVVTITADREVTFAASLANTPDCGLAPANAASSDEFALVHSFVLEPMCLGEGYDLSVIAYDRTRAAAGTIYQFGREQGPRISIAVPPVLLYISSTVEVTMPNTDEHSYTAYVYPVSMQMPDAAIPLGASLRWSWPAADRSRAAAEGWQLFGLDGRANACSTPQPGPLTVNAPRRPAPVSQDAITVTLVVEVYENLEPGGPIGECARGPLVTSHLLQATVGIADLTAGVTLTDETGRVELTVRATTWRDELVG